MSKRRIVAWIVSIVGLLTAATLAGAQDAQEASPEEADADEAQEETPAPGDELGDPPPPRGQDARETTPSPLTPRPNEMPKTEVAPAPPEYDRLLSDIAALRSRVSALTTTLFESKVRIIVQTEGDDAQIASLVVTLDDGVVFTGKPGFIAEDERTVYEHAVAPGHHTVGVEIERVDLRGKEFTTWQASKFAVIVPDSKTLEAHLILEDDSDMAEDYPEDGDGEYELSVRLRARASES